MQFSKSQKQFRISQKNSLSPVHQVKPSPDKTKIRLQLQNRKKSELFRFVISPKNFHSESSMIQPSESKIISHTTQNSQMIFPPESEEQLTVVVHQSTGQLRFTFSRNITTTQLRTALIQKIKTQSRILQFTTLEKNHLVDYYLSLEEKSVKILAEKALEVQPFFLEVGEGKVGLRDFQILKCIGSGGFSKVYLVRWKQNGRFYAMKLVDKEFILKHRKQELIQNERDIMSIINHPFAIQMLFCFEQRNFIVFVLEFCSGGELFYQLKQLKRMSEDQAQFYFTEICLAMLYLHQMGIIYRDIKPENILIDADGHVRIADFGLSKITSPDEYAYSFCGSPEYMAPEMLLKQGHGLQVDHYCLGALLYELVTGLPPFYSKNTQKIYDSILHEPISFPSNLSSEIKDLMSGLLHKDPSQRLGFRDGVREILQHKWFRRISVSDVLAKRVAPPIKPQQFKLNFELKNLAAQDLEIREKLMGKTGFKKDFRMFEDIYFDHRENLHSNEQQLLLREYKRYVDRIQVQKPKSLDRIDKTFGLSSSESDKMAKLKKRLEDQQSLRCTPKPMINQFVIPEKLKTESSVGTTKRQN